jgi:hypothetical protein
MIEELNPSFKPEKTDDQKLEKFINQLQTANDETRIGIIGKIGTLIGETEDTHVLDKAESIINMLRLPQKSKEIFLKRIASRREQLESASSAA